MMGRGEEDLMKNPFLRVLRSSFEPLYRAAAERGEATTILIPCAECLDGENFSQIFIETHLLLSACTPGCYMNLLGQGVEIKESVSTHMGFTEQRTCEVLQTESMYDCSNTFRVLVTDKPLVGKYRILPGAADRPKVGVSVAVTPAHDGTNEDWLNAAPAISDDFFDQVNRFRKTFVRVPGCEQSTAERMREITGATSQRLIRHHKLSQPSQQRQVDYQVSWNAYAALHSFVFPHLQNILTRPEEQLEKAIRSYQTAGELLDAMPDAAGRGLGTVDVRGCAEQLALMDHKITPHEKIACIEAAYSALQQCAAATVRSSLSMDGVVEITGDDVLFLFILAVHGSELTHRLAHVAHVEMYLQGAAGRSGTFEAARFEEVGYAVSAFQAALQFILNEKTRSSTQKSRATTNVFSSYLQPAGTGVEVDGDNDRANATLQGLTRQIRRVSEADH